MRKSLSKNITKLFSKVHMSSKDNMNKRSSTTEVVDAEPPLRDRNEWEIWCVIEKQNNGKKENEESSEKQQTERTTNNSSCSPTLTGGCHCGGIRFKCIFPLETSSDNNNNKIVVWNCNCSDCRLRQNSHFIVPQENLTIDGLELLQDYRWGTGTAIHKFCKVCGISPFYIPRSNPDGYAVTFACLDMPLPKEITVVDVRRFDGVHWEDCIENECKDIKNHSK